MFPPTWITRFCTGHYDGKLLIGKIDPSYGYRPVVWTTETHFTLGHDKLEVQSLKATSGPIAPTG